MAGLVETQTASTAAVPLRLVPGDTRSVAIVAVEVDFGNRADCRHAVVGGRRVRR